MRSPLILSLVLLIGVTKGLYITDDRARDPSRPLPLPPEAELPSHSRGSFGGNLVRRQTATTSSSATAPQRSSPSSTPSLPIAPPTAPANPPAPVPTPMDLQLSYALTTPCLSYLSTLLSTPTFLTCLPFSLLLTTSTGFASLISTASSTGNYTTLNTLLAYVTSPKPTSGQCDDFMSAAYAKMGESSSGCKADLAKRSAAAEARTGLGNAAMMRKAAALRNPDTGSWCYLEALASERPDDLYLWSLPTGIALPASSRPSCSKCSSLLLRHYHSSATSTPSLNSTLVNLAVGTINGACGQNFAEYSTSPASSGASQLGPSVGVITLAIAAATLAAM